MMVMMAFDVYVMNSEARKMPVLEIEHAKVLKGLNMTHEQFVDLCILLGCDYCDNIKGIGPKKAIEYIRKYGSLEQVLKNIDTNKYHVPEYFPYQEVRKSFLEAEVLDPSTVKVCYHRATRSGS